MMNKVHSYLHPILLWSDLTCESHAARPTREVTESQADDLLLIRQALDIIAIPTSHISALLSLLFTVSLSSLTSHASTLQCIAGCAPPKRAEVDYNELGE